MTELSIERGLDAGIRGRALRFELADDCLDTSRGCEGLDTNEKGVTMNENMPSRFSGSRCII